MTPRNHNLTYTNRRYLDAIADHVVIFDGAMGTSVQLYNLKAEDFGGERYNGLNEMLVLTRPDVIEEIHSSFLAVGSEIVETCTFRGNRLTLGEFGLSDRTIEINRAAAQVARRACEKAERETGIPRFVAGSIGRGGHRLQDAGLQDRPVHRRGLCGFQQAMRPLPVPFRHQVTCR